MEDRSCRRQIAVMHKAKTWKCLACDAEVPDWPMTMLRHQLGHVERRGHAVDRVEPDGPPADDQHQRQ